MSASSIQRSNVSLKDDDVMPTKFADFVKTVNDATEIDESKPSVETQGSFIHNVNWDYNFPSKMSCCSAFVVKLICTNK